jgi:hypothetical protein
VIVEEFEQRSDLVEIQPFGDFVAVLAPLDNP